MEFMSKNIKALLIQIRSGLVLKGGPEKKIHSAEAIEGEPSFEFYPHPLLLNEYGNWFKKFEKTSLKIDEISRMALKISALPILPKKMEFISKPTPYGGLQVTPDGSAYILLSERQSIGGYPVMGIFPPMALHTLLNLKKGQDFSIDLISKF